MFFRAMRRHSFPSEISDLYLLVAVTPTPVHSRQLFNIWSKSDSIDKITFRDKHNYLQGEDRDTIEFLAIRTENVVKQHYME